MAGNALPAEIIEEPADWSSVRVLQADGILPLGIAGQHQHMAA
jgi:hypothetical protein